MGKEAELFVGGEQEAFLFSGWSLQPYYVHYVTITTCLYSFFFDFLLYRAGTFS